MAGYLYNNVFYDLEDINNRYYEYPLTEWSNSSAISNYIQNTCRLLDKHGGEILYKVYRDHLINLIENINIILSEEYLPKNILARMLLPTKSYDEYSNVRYDESYFETLDKVKKDLENLLEKDNSGTFIYYGYW